MKLLFTNATFLKIIPETRVLDQFDTFLSILYRCRTGCTFDVIEDVFGGDSTTHSRTFGKCLSGLVLYFKNTIKIPTREEATKRMKYLKKKQYPNPQNILIGDCVDTPIHIADASYYTSKKNCSSQKAIRVSGALKKCSLLIKKTFFRV